MALGPLVLAPTACSTPTWRVSANRLCDSCWQHSTSRLGCKQPTSPAHLLTSALVPGRSRGARGLLQINALDAAMPFDFESRATSRMKESKQLTVGIVGFGTFGQFLAKRLVQAGHKVLATSRTNYQAEAREIGVSYYRDADDFCEEHPDVVILACAILALEKVVGTLPLQRLRRSTLVVDVLSVKQFPKQLLLSSLPPEMDVLCTHPMFGPDSGKGSWGGLNFMYDKVRIGAGSQRQARIDGFLQFFAEQGCRMVEMSCEEHDRLAAGTQFITHTVGRVLGEMGLQTTSIDTKGFEALLRLVDNTNNDSFDLYYGLFMYNQNATEELARLEAAFDSVKRQLFTRLHALLRQQLLTPGMPPGAQLPPVPELTSTSPKGLLSSSSEQEQSAESPTAAGAASSSAAASGLKSPGAGSNGNKGEVPGHAPQTVSARLSKDV